jgi:hypothetical protein
LTDKYKGHYVRVRNLLKYQHYKTRNPPWVKLHAAVLEDYEFGHLEDASKAHALLILVLAARLNNRIPADPAWIGSRIAARSKVDLDALLGIGFLELFKDGGEVVEAVAPAEDNKPEAKPKDDSPALLTFETTGKVKSWDLTEAQLAGWQADYPGLDLLSECRQARAWAMANGKKTAQGMPAYLVGWFNRSVRGGANRKAPANPRRQMGTDPTREAAIADLGKNRTINMDEIQ